MKRLLAATALTLTIAAPAAAFDDTENLRGWDEDNTHIRSYEHSTNAAIRECVDGALEAMRVNKATIIFGDPNSNVRAFMPAANHYREHTIMPNFEACLRQARG